jgi:nitroreductase
MTDFFKLIKDRHSVRSFQPKAVEEDKVRRILEAANAAPSAGDLQAYEMVLVKEAKNRKALSEAAWGQPYVAQAPLSLVFLAHPARSAGRYGGRGRNLYSLQDATIAAAYVQLAAVELGLASVWVGAFDDQAVRDVVGAGPELVPAAIIVIGYAAESPAATPRRSLSDIVHQEKLKI